MRCRVLPLASFTLLAVLWAFAGARAQTATMEPPVGEEEGPNGPLGVRDSKAAVFGSFFYGALSGSQIEHADPGLGFEVGASVRVISSFSAWASIARSSFNVSGQIRELLDTHIRSDGRSATVDGSLQFTRVRAGLRVDGLRDPSFRAQPYFVAAAVLSRNEAKLNTVDGGTPPHPSFRKTKVGAYARVGVDVGLTSRLDVDGFGCYEAFAFPASANASLGIGAGIRIRL